MSGRTTIRRIPDIMNDLMEIAASGGSPHLLDSDAERTRARGVIEGAIAERHALDDDAAACGVDLLEEAQELLEEGGRLQVNGLFADLLGYRCRGARLFGHYVLMGGVDVELLSEVDDDDYASCYVFHHGGGWRTHLEEEALTAAEWEEVVAPLAALVPEGAALVCDANAAFSAMLERTALAEAIANYERIVGPKAGTANDLGGHLGNTRIDMAYQLSAEFRNREAREAEGQQDCINELQTTRHFITLLIQHGLLVYHALDANASTVGLSNYGHHAVRLVEQGHPDAQVWAVDSWVSSNGYPPEILTEESWHTKWTKVFGNER